MEVVIYASVDDTNSPGRHNQSQDSKFVLDQIATWQSIGSRIQAW